MPKVGIVTDSTCDLPPAELDDARRRDGAAHGALRRRARPRLDRPHARRVLPEACRVPGSAHDLAAVAGRLPGGLRSPRRGRVRGDRLDPPVGRALRHLRVGDARGQDSPVPVRVVDSKRVSQATGAHREGRGRSARCRSGCGRRRSARARGRRARPASTSCSTRSTTWSRVGARARPPALPPRCSTSSRSCASTTTASSSRSRRSGAASRRSPRSPSTSPRTPPRTAACVSRCSMPAARAAARNSRTPSSRRAPTSSGTVAWRDRRGHRHLHRPGRRRLRLLPDRLTGRRA